MNNYLMMRSLILTLSFASICSINRIKSADLPSGFEVFFNDAAHSNANDIDQELAKMIGEASVSVEGAFYSITRSVIVDAFIEAANRIGYENVRIITDASNRGDYGCRRLIAAGITVLDETCDGWSADAFESHNKFCVVDGEKVWTGSYNITDSCSIYNNNNAVRIDCPALAEAYLVEFNEMWGALSGPPGDCHFSTNKTTSIPHTYDCNGVRVDLYFSPTKDAIPNRALEAIESLLENAQESLHFCIYTFTSDQIASAFISAFNTGKSVHGVMDDSQAESPYSRYNTLKNKGIDVMLDSDVTPHGNYLHHKFAVVDYDSPNAAVITGSYNWTSSAQSKNDENTIIIYNQAIAEKYYEEFYRCYYGKNPDTGDPQISIDCNQSNYQAGNYMRVSATYLNPGKDRVLDEYIILDLGDAFESNRFYFWPGWTIEPDCQRMYMIADETDTQEIFGFVLPYPLPAMGPFTIWAAFVDPETNMLAGEYDFTQFSFSD